MWLNVENGRGGMWGNGTKDNQVISNVLVVSITFLVVAIALVNWWPQCKQLAHVLWDPSARGAW